MSKRRSSPSLSAVAAAATLVSLAPYAARAQTPAPDNYAVIAVGADAQLDSVRSLNHSDSNSVLGNYSPRDGSRPSAAIGFLTSRTLLPKFAGDTSDYYLMGGDGSLTAGYRQKYVYGQTNLSHAIGYDGATLTDLELLARQQLGFPQADLVSGAGDVQGNTIVGYTYSNNAFFEHALRWQKTAGGYVVTDLHQAANLDAVFGPAAFSGARGVSGNAVVGFAAKTYLLRHAMRLDGVGAGFSVADLHPQTLLGADSFSEAFDVDGGLSVGIGGGVLTGTRAPTQYPPPSAFRYLYHAFGWQGTIPTDLHQATNLSSILGAEPDSGAYSVAGNVIVGYGNGANYGTNIYNHPGYDPFPGDRYNSHALRWTIETNGSVTLLDLHRFLPRTANYSTAGGYGGESIAADGTIIGVYRNTGDAAENPVYWKPLAPDAGIPVPIGATTYLTKSFVQTAGTTKIGGTLDLTSGVNAATYTLSGGNLNGSGLIRGTVSNTGGTFTPPLKPLPQSGPIIIPGPAYTPLTIQGSYSQRTNGALLLGLSNKGSSFVQINGSAMLQGTLALSVSGVTPTNGTNFQFAEVTGTATVAFTSGPVGWTVSAVKGSGFPASTKLYLVYTGGKPKGF